MDFLPAAHAVARGFSRNGPLVMEQPVRSAALTRSARHPDKGLGTGKIPASAREGIHVFHGRHEE
jgi:hypothetical protein